MVFSDQQQNHWSYQRATLPSLPHVGEAAWPQASVDYFVLQQLEQRGLRPAQPAHKRQLIRRAYFDLIGLPPSPAQVHAFLADQSPSAFERVIDELLASPHYGERWGRHWLDIARYADSNGLDENVAFQYIYKYRDWVIRALNRDMPYKQFVVEQLAGDLIAQAPNETQQDYIERVKAVGFLSVGPKMVADDDPKKKKMDLIDEQLNTVGQAFMGMTLGCARCHDHKFDPISTYDYYAMAGIFKSTKTLENLRVVAPIYNHEFKAPGFEARLKQHQKELKSLDDGMERWLDRAAESFLDEHRQRSRDYLAAALDWGVFGPLPNAEFDIVREAEDFQMGDGNKETNDDTTFLKSRSNVEYEFDLSEGGRYRLFFRYAAKEKNSFRWTLDGGKSIEHKPWLVVKANDSPAAQRWIPELEIDLTPGTHSLKLDNIRINVDKWALIRTADKPIDGSWTRRSESLASQHKLDRGLLQQWIRHLLQHQLPGDSHWWTPLRQAIGDADKINHELDQLEMLFADAINSAAPKPAKRLLAAANPYYWMLYAKQGPYRRPDDFQRRLRGVPRDRLAELKRQRAELEREKPTPEYVMAATDGKPEDLTVMLRGNYLTPGIQTKRSFPRIIEGDDCESIGKKQSGRLELARWMTNADHPLTARVIVNRVWRWHFGRGIVPTTDNFGLLGQQPTHPELLDWLAVTFVKDHWSIKKLHKRIMLSATYQMSSQRNESAIAADPENQWLWRFPRRRLEAEPIRDAMLAVSDALDGTMHGSLMAFQDRQYVTGTASKVTQYNNRRRTVYQPVYRSAVYDVLTAFDFPDPATLNGDRQTSIVAPQALLMMNSDLVEQATRALAETLVKLDGTDESRMTWLYERLFSRLPTTHELATIGQTLSLLQQRQRGDGATVQNWQSVCRALMVTNEFIYID